MTSGFKVQVSGHLWFYGQKVAVKLTGYSPIQQGTINDEARAHQRLGFSRILQSTGVLTITKGEARRAWPMYDHGVLGSDTLVKFGT